MLAGGVGAARYLQGALEAFEPSSVAAVVNTADDVVLHGLHVSPDLDTCVYTLGGGVDAERGWGLADETWHAMEALGRYGDGGWFSLGDRDLATHLHRSGRLAQGATLSEATAEITAAWGLRCALLPMTDDEVQTRVTLAAADGTPGAEVGFQEYFVRLAHSVAITGVRFAGVEAAEPTSAALQAVADASAVVIAPSNPVVSIGPILALPQMTEALRSRRERNAAVSPIVGGAALKGPAARMLRELGEEPSVVGVARRYRHIAAVLVIDTADAGLAAAVAEAGMEPLVMPTVMDRPGVAKNLALACHAAVARPDDAEAANGQAAHDEAADKAEDHRAAAQ